MSRKEDRLWGEGFARACEIAKKEGLQALFAEQRFRGLSGFHGRLTTTELDGYDSDIKNLIFAMLRISFVSVLYDEFGFRWKRLNRFLEAVDKIYEYTSNGWIYWIDMVEEIRQRIGFDLSIENGKTHMKTYDRPDNADIYEEPDLIVKGAWDKRLKSLGLMDDGTQVSNPAGTMIWQYENEYDKIQIYDELGGIEIAVNRLGAKKPGEAK